MRLASLRYLQESPIRPVIVIARIGTLAALCAIPMGQAEGVPVRADEREAVASEAWWEPEPPPTRPTLEVSPVPEQVAATLRVAPSPQLMADLFTAPTAPTPAWAMAWRGPTPASEPGRALTFSQADPEAYADWLKSTLPPGSTVRRRWAVVTAYCPCEICCDQRTGVTATGRDTDVHPYGIAADWRLLRRGTRVHVPGYLTESTVGGAWDVDDTGGALRRSREHGVLHIDVRYVSHWWAERWGTRRMWIYQVEGPAAAADGG